MSKVFVARQKGMQQNSRKLITTLIEWLLIKYFFVTKIACYDSVPFKWNENYLHNLFGSASPWESSAMAITSRQLSAVLCFCIFANKHKIDINSQKLLAAGLIDEKKEPVDLFKSLAKKFQLKANIRKFSGKGRFTLSFPFAYQDQDGVFMLVMERNEAGYTIVNPLFPTDRSTSSLQEVHEASRGSVFEITETGGTEEQNRRFGADWFGRRLVKFKSLLVKIVVASLMLQLFATATPLFSQVIIDKVLVRNNPSMLYVLGLGMLIVISFELILTILRSRQQSHIASKIDIELGTYIKRHMMRLPLGYFHHRSSGQVIGIFRELDTLRGFLTGPSATSIVDISFIFVFLPLMYNYSGRLTLITISTGLVMATVAILTKPLELRNTKEQSFATTEAQTRLIESVSNIETVKVLGAESIIRGRWESAFARLVLATKETSGMQGTVQAVNASIQRLSTLLVLWAGAELVIQGQLSAGQLIAFQMLSMRVLHPMQRMTHLWHELKKVEFSLERLGEIMNSATESEGATAIGSVLPKGDIVLHNVSFRYGDQATQALRNLSLTFGEGKSTALIGNSGSGKSTLLKLLLKLQHQTIGVIKYGTTDLRSIDPTLLRKRVSMVAQDTQLFAMTIADNIAIRAPWASIEQVVAAAQCVGADLFIDNLKHGYHTVLGENGTALSGGQRQRIAIARAILDEPDVLILDEATSALDFQSEKLIYRNLFQLFESRKIIIITHRIQSIEHCDQIHVLAEGELLASGSHEMLMATCPTYRAMTEHGAMSAEPEITAQVQYA